VKYACIEEHRQEFEVRLICRALTLTQTISVLILFGGNDRHAGVTANRPPDSAHTGGGKEKATWHSSYPGCTT
jgi:hypothetical protein